jgi:hypothetical protein
MKVIQTDLEERQIEALQKITVPGRISRAEHIRRAIDMYLSRPAIQAALVELEKEPEAQELAPTDVQSYPCASPKLDEHCSGCTDPDLFGATHQGCTIEHGCELLARTKAYDSLLHRHGTRRGPTVPSLPH